MQSPTYLTTWESKMRSKRRWSPITASPSLRPNTVQHKRITPLMSHQNYCRVSLPMRIITRIKKIIMFRSKTIQPRLKKIAEIDCLKASIKVKQDFSTASLRAKDQMIMMMMKKFIRCSLSTSLLKRMNLTSLVLAAADLALARWPISAKEIKRAT